jgi:N-acetylmuramoyl-L-alanine amidase
MNRTFTIFGILLGTLLAVQILFYHIVVPVTILLTPDMLPIIVIDPGHGGFDGGAVTGGVIEKEINLSVALKLRDLMAVCGYPTVMTRESDISTADSNPIGKSRKASDIHNRLALLESCGNAVFISIHQNKFHESRYSGAQVFYSPNHPDSRLLAQKLQDRFRTLLQPDNTREIKQAGSELYLMYHAQTPAILAECGFLSNPQECRNLTTPEYQSRVALTILSAAADYLYETQRP